MGLNGWGLNGWGLNVGLKGIEERGVGLKGDGLLRGVGLSGMVNVRFGPFLMASPSLPSLWRASERMGPGAENKGRWEGDAAGTAAAAAAAFDDAMALLSRL